MKRFFIALLAIVAASCSPQEATEEMLAKTTPEKLAHQASKDIETLATAGRIELNLPVTQVGYHWNSVVGAPSTAQIVFEDTPDKDGNLNLLVLNYTQSNETYTLQGFEIERRDSSALSIPALKFSEGSPLGWLAAAFGIAFLAVSVVATFLAARTKGLKRKWLWIIGCILAIGNFKVGWASGAYGIGIGAQVLGFGATAMMGAEEWVLSLGLPVFATIFLWRRMKGTLNIVEPAIGDAA